MKKNEFETLDKSSRIFVDGFQPISKSRMFPRSIGQITNDKNQELRVAPDWVTSENTQTIGLAVSVLGLQQLASNGGRTESIKEADAQLALNMIDYAQGAVRQSETVEQAYQLLWERENILRAKTWTALKDIALVDGATSLTDQIFVEHSPEYVAAKGILIGVGVGDGITSYRDSISELGSQGRQEMEDFPITEDTIHLNWLGKVLDFCGLGKLKEFESLELQEEYFNRTPLQKLYYERYQQEKAMLNEDDTDDIQLSDSVENQDDSSTSCLDCDIDENGQCPEPGFFSAADTCINETNMYDIGHIAQYLPDM